MKTTYRITVSSGTKNKVANEDNILDKSMQHDTIKKGKIKTTF